MNKPLAVCTDYDDLNPIPGVQALEEIGFKVVVLDTRDQQQVLQHARDAVAILCSNLLVDSYLMQQMPRLQIISQLGQGVDNIDVAYATEHGIWVCNIDDVASTEVAEHAWALIYALTRELKFFTSFTNETWLARPPILPRRLSEMTLGLVGIGRIGYKIGLRAQHHVARTVCFDFTQRPNAVPPGVERIMNLHAMLSISDIVSVQMPLNERTYHIIDQAAIDQMPHGSYLINVGRGALVAANAVKASIDTGQLAGYATDVYETEPPGENDPLLNHPRILTTPHIGYLSHVSQPDYITRQYGNIVDWATTGRPTYPLNYPNGFSRLQD